MPDSVHNHRHSQNRFAVIPTPEKLGVDDRYSARGIRIAFLDSGFYPHPDFASRVVEFHDIAGEERSLDRILKPEAHHWHGTQTVTACAGDGSLSDGRYRGLAYRAELVLVKATRNGRIGDREIEDGLRWILQNHGRLEIRVLNISLGGDCDLPTADSQINMLIEALISRGIAVTVAAGNSSDVSSAPPASSPSAITVGGYSDENQFVSETFDLYHSSHGRTADELIKPELIAPAMYVAAPILPTTPDYDAAETLSMLAVAPDYSFHALLLENQVTAGLGEEVSNLSLEEARGAVETALQRRKIVDTHYQHVDGTSFAAPIAASVVAVMLEANPSLTPGVVKNILVSTAKRLSGRPAVRQGFGVIDARAAISAALNETHFSQNGELHPPRIAGRKIVFRFHHDDANSISLAGDFNDWKPVELIKCESGIWEIGLDCLPSGKYRYKFQIDDTRWIEDPSHGLKEDDGLGGFNSILVIE